MQLVDRIEKRRFVGREFLLWLWFESELFDATLATADHGPFGLWLEKQLLLSEGKESTKITAASPGLGREAKEALLRGQLPKSAGIRLAWKGDETSFSLAADQLSIGGLRLQTVLGQEEEEKVSLEELRAMMTQPPPRKGRKPQRGEDDEVYEAFYERMRLTEEFEALLCALYRDFIALRLSPVFEAHVAPAIQSWARGQALDVDAYREARDATLKPGSTRRAAPAEAQAAAAG